MQGVLFVAVLLSLAVAGVIVAVALVSMGWGGEMAEFPPDVPPLRLPDPDALSAADVVGVRLPMGLVGYHPGSVDETLRRSARAMNEREARIAILERRLADLTAMQSPNGRPPAALGWPAGLQHGPERAPAPEMDQAGQNTVEEPADAADGGDDVATGVNPYNGAGEQDSVRLGLGDGVIRRETPS